ncbi:MAG: acetyltransferase [Rummeliibacillus sp.]
MEKIIVLGMGGHAKSIVDAIERQNNFQVAGYVVNEEPNKKVLYDYPIIGKDKDLKSLFEQGIHNIAIGIGFLGRNEIRKKLYYLAKNLGYFFPIICDPSAIISQKVKIEEGTFIGKGAIVNAGTYIGKMCILNTGAIIEHDCIIDDFSHVAVGTVLCGRVKVGKQAFIGANATVIQEKFVGNNCIVAAGTVVRKDIEHGVFIGE